MATSTSNAIRSLLVLCFSAGAVGNLGGQETGQPDAASAQGSALAALREAVRALDQVKRADGQLPDKEVLRLWFEVAPLFFALGDRDAADRAFAKARDLTEEFAATNDFGEYQFLGLAYAKVGNVDAVVKLAKAIQDSIPDHRGSGAELRRVILGDAAMAAGKAGRLADGLRIAKSIRDANYRSAIESTARREDIMRRARTGDFAGANAAADKMRTDLGRVRMLVGNVVLNPLTGEDLTPSEWGIALIQMDLGDRDGARATI
jgi:tetratricopeptide (TPR) repeat protein